MNVGLKLASHFFRTAGVSRAGSVVAKTTFVFTRTSPDSDSSTAARLAMWSGQTSGQWV